MGHARALLGIEEDEDRLALARRAVEEKMAVREVEKAVANQRAGRSKKKASKEVHRDPHIRDYEERLQHRFGTAVNIRRTANKGWIQVEFYNDSDLERLLDLMIDSE